MPTDPDQIASGAILNGVPFFVNPSTVQWNYNVKLSTTPTIGGKVVQLFGWSMGDLVISGSFGKDGVERQDAFFQMVNTTAERQAPQVLSTGALAARPVRFLWPEQDWDFWVFIRDFKQSGTSVSIENTPQMFAPKYTLTLFVYEDNGTVVHAATENAMLAYMQRLSAGLGWKQSAWNGPQNEADLQAVLKGQSFIDWAYAQTGLAPIIDATPVGQVIGPNGSTDPNAPDPTIDTSPGTGSEPTP